ncbi:MAG: hypothetical protein KBF35_08020 [Saprospiraceae bacterium]|nr:hypothetical protein [Saprospiraceae bacterium]
MKYQLLIFLLSISNIAFGQSTFDLEGIINDWTEGKIGSNDSVIKADVNRGGWYHLVINSDKKVEFIGPFECGFGSKRLGTWAVNKSDTTITFFFTKRLGYMNKPDIVDINDTETYKIKLLTTDKLILTQIVGQRKKTWPFLRTEK